MRCRRSMSCCARRTASGPASLQFSLLEALYARGFTSRAQIQALSPAEFEYALTGTVAYPFAAAIQAAAGGSAAGSPPVPPGPFTPINPDGSLVNCIPPWHLSPLGPVKYLQDSARHRRRRDVRTSGRDRRHARRVDRAAARSARRPARHRRERLHDAAADRHRQRESRGARRQRRARCRLRHQRHHARRARAQSSR